MNEHRGGGEGGEVLCAGDIMGLLCSGAFSSFLLVNLFVLACLAR